jgi:hypothetical protein
MRDFADAIAATFEPQAGKNCRVIMVNKTFLPGLCRLHRPISPIKTITFSTGTAFALSLANRGLGEPWRFA